jgi:drug/metabolite transporter (DMT)-like permease
MGCPVYILFFCGSRMIEKPVIYSGLPPRLEIPCPFFLQYPQETMKNLKAHLAGLSIVCIWSGWIAISRHGVQTELQPADITLLRYGTALIGVSPLILRHTWSKFKLYQYLVVGLGVGFPYTLFSFYGLREIRAAHAGVLVNGMLPVLGLIVAWGFYRQRITLLRYGAIALIFISNVIMAGGDTFSSDHLFGIFLLLSAAVVYTMHMTGIRQWAFGWRDVLVAVPVVNVVLFLPLWFFFPTALFHAPFGDIALQSFYQGVVVNIVALMFVAYSIRRLGLITVSLYMSFVPVVTAFFAWIFLGESLNVWEICGIAGCSMGLILYATGRAPLFLNSIIKKSES